MRSDRDQVYFQAFRRLLVGVAVIVLVAVFLFWRIDSDRVDHLRFVLVDSLVPVIEIGLEPGKLLQRGVGVLRDIGNAQRNAEELNIARKELERLRQDIRELQHENSSLKKLVDLVDVPDEAAISAKVLADTSSPFSHSLLISAGSENSVELGWPVTDGDGIIGRIADVSRTAARVILLTDPSSRIPIKILPSGTRGLAVGDHTAQPLVQLLERVGRANPGDRVLTTGEGGVFPPNYLVGTLAINPDGRVRVLPSADLRDLIHLKVVRYRPQDFDRTEPRLITGGGTQVDR